MVCVLSRLCELISVQILVIPVMLLFLSERVTLLVACFISAGCYTLQGIFSSKGLFIALVGVSSMGSMMNSLPSVMLSRRVHSSHQGALDAATGVSNTIVQALADIIFSTAAVWSVVLL